MTVYIYRCGQCSNGDFEADQPFASSPLTRCPNCEGPVRRVIQPVGHFWKGQEKPIDTTKFDKAYEEKVKRE